MRADTAAVILGGFLLAACTTETVSDDDDDGGGEGGSGGGVTAPQGIPVLGSYDHTFASVDYQWIGTAADGLSVPRDAAFNPLNPAELWVTSRANNSVIIFTNPGTPEQTSQWTSGSGSEHFLAQPSGIAMGNNGFFATIHETDDQTQGLNGTPADFMGPTLWRAEPSTFEGGHASHWDMLHNSPNGMGIAWQRDNVYWVFDGYHSSITMYDFRFDHGAAGSDHTDGIVTRYVEGEVTWVENVPSHMEFDPPGGNLLYIADTGNSRIAVLDTATGSPGGDTFPNYDGTTQTQVNGASMTTLVDGLSLDPPMTMPSGLAIHDGHIFVTDNASSTIFAFDMQGQLVDWLVMDNVPAGSLTGVTFDTVGQLYTADALGNTVHRISAKAEQPMQ